MKDSSKKGWNMGRVHWDILGEIVIKDISQITRLKGMVSIHIKINYGQATGKKDS